MKVLVTGASGMLGRALTTALQRRGDNVTVLQRRSCGLDVNEVLGDITSADDVQRAVDGQEAVVHLAARVSFTGPYPDFERVNVGGTSCLLDAMQAASVSRLVHVSSPSVAHAGRALVGAGAAQADPTSSRGAYARSKAVAEQRVLAADTANGGWASVLAIRPHLVWGPGDNQLVGRIVERARRGRLALVGRGNSLIDTTYVDNAVDALCAALDRTDSAEPGHVHGEAFVVSNGEPRTVAELVSRICSAARVEGPRVRLPFALAYSGGAAVERIWPMTKRAGEPPMTRFLAEQLSTAHWFDQRRTREALRWSPAVALDEGFVRLAAWFSAKEARAVEG